MGLFYPVLQLRPTGFSGRLKNVFSSRCSGASLVSEEATCTCRQKKAHYVMAETARPFMGKMPVPEFEKLHDE
jgi:hypothetical protein